MSDYRFEELTPSDFPELVALMDDAFGMTTPADYFDWKYARNPAGPAVGQVARAANGEMAAFYGMIPMAYQGPSGPVTIYQSCDTMTSSRHRRKGLFQQLAERLYAAALDRDPDFYIYGFGGPTSTPGFLKMGWRVVDEVPYLFEPWPLTALRARGGGAMADGAAVPAPASLDPRPGSILRTPDFLAWKAENPLRRGFSAIERGGSYAAVSRSDDFAFLVDFVEHDRASARAVLGAVRAMSRGTKGILTFAQPGSTMYQALRRHGFLRNPFGRGPASGTIPLIAFGRSPWPERDWAVTPLDHDAY